MDNLNIQNNSNVTPMMKSPKVVAFLVLGGAIILSSIIASFAFYKIRSFDDSLSVTGSAKQEIVSDTVTWNSGFSRVVTIDNLRYGYSQMSGDEKIVKDYLIKSGVAETDFTISPVTMNEIFDYKPNGDQGDKKYNLSQSVILNSKDVEKVTSLAKNAPQEIVSKGVIFTSYGLNYYYSKLPDLRVSLLSGAIKDAKARAESIAGASGKKVGQLKSASSGVVQVMPLNSVEVNDYGSYDTGEIKKEVMVTVKAAFTLR